MTLMSYDCCVDMKIEAWFNQGFAGSDICDMPLDESKGIKRELCQDLSVERFIEEYEMPAIPLVIEGVPEDENWPACENWTLKVQLLLSMKFLHPLSF
jgi:hypothetical protein